MYELLFRIVWQLHNCNKYSARSNEQSHSLKKIELKNNNKQVFMISKNTYFWKEMMHNQIFPNSRVANHSININSFTAIQWSIETRRLSSWYIVAYLKI